MPTFALSQRMMEEMRDGPLTRVESRVLAQICLTLPEGQGLVSQAEVATALDMGRDNVNRAIDILLSRGILERVEKSGRSWIYRIVPEMIRVVPP
jgi:DNA-binding GntR family transcriptional regulator